ncbi:MULTISPECIES: hypothetical protein [Mesorhizobium]|uniref:Uncharacterized protein n=4 Tax=Mesorhizobium TaxID=68287 RepID=A0AB38TFS2_9HYPH|nr:MULTISPECIES: hypothetical protein [Mesorhizobium]MDF3215785.1 hypothetical protein [Mesorhizobium ciceri]RUY67022.1 hypothetical protein EN965_16135 [Mesorhizobium sp. M7A.F.Ca.CA.001.05.1.1]RUY67654.1 hypothetical protein EN980_16760 [Mesorhizobium sp. M7A.F.Ca.CA.001.13.1.1]RUZ09718.1 hypothetical protein EN955_03680 [Mesorhizobium sp. M7A.F.Ca.CA.001.04.2.1]RUZ20120.1 hypothetical protein EN961_16910 [Mesorhizobium sp. M7A.F.Ca.CA.001.09.1.1]
MSLNHEANGARHISANDSAVVRRADEDFEELIRSIRAATHQALPLFEEEPVTGLAQSDTLAASLGSTSARTGSSQAHAMRGSSLLSNDDDLAWSLVEDYVARLNAQTHDADAPDTDKWDLQEEVAKLQRLQDRTSKELGRKSRELSIASKTIADLEVQLNRARQTIAQADRHAGQRATRFLEANVEVERLGRNLARVSGQLRDETMARQAAEQAREDVASRLASLQQAAMLLRSKVADYQLHNERLTGKLSAQMLVQQDLQARLSTVEHQRGVLGDCAAAAQERAVELEKRLRSLQRSAPDQSVVRATPSAGQRAEDVAEHRRQTSETEIANLRQERDAARRDCGAVKVQLADLRLRGMTDELAHARCRNENRQLHQRLETLTRQDPPSGPAADDSADLERTFDELLAAGEIGPANDGDPSVARKAC